ncbi:MAG: helix-turn-helix transcriptional regulator [Symploca sp. SIO2D2]|nr:helix-turn-helix transcriptional regulator [Symploca sp. SIO2G7]NEQ64426.1 helix-turn-helix transcriptional regulator [Symploca sp. SIO2D2]
MMKNDIGVLGQVLTQQVLAQIEQDLTEVEANNPYKRQAKIIRFLREMKRLDQKQLGKLLGVDHSTISRYERLGCNDLKVICRLARIFGISLDVFSV